MVSGGGWGGGKTQFSLRGQSLGVWPCCSEYMGNTNWTFLWGGFTRVRVDLEGMESNCDRGVICEIPK